MNSYLHPGSDASRPFVRRLLRRCSGVHAWMLIRLGVVVFVATALGVAASYSLFSIEAQRRAQVQADTRLNAVVGLLGRERDSLGSIGQDYASWDETLDFFRNRNEKYLVRNFAEGSVQNVGVDFVAFQEADGSLFRTVDFTRNGTLPELHGALKQQILAAIDRMVRGNAPQLAAFTQIGDRPTILVRSLVTDGQRSVPGSGWLLFGRYLDGEFVERLQADIGFSFGIEVDAGRSGRRLGVRGGSVVAPLEGQRILEGSTISLRIEEDATSSSKHAQTLRLLAGVAGLIALIAAACVMLLLDAHFVSRIRRFGSIARVAVQQGELRVRWPDDRRDEIDALGGALNQLLEQLDAARQHLGDLAATDALTGLGNRRRLLDHIESLRRQYPVAIPSHVLVLFDIDDFKLVNDGIGHNAGDSVLEEFGDRVRRIVGGDDLAVRLGGDEFAVLLAGDYEYAEAFCERLRASLALPVLYEGRPLVLGVSIGLASSRPGEGVEDWVRNADMAMYISKRNGKHQATVFEDSMRIAAKRRVDLAQSLRKAVEARTLETWYQPIVDGRNGSVTGLEALVRWRKGDDFVPPSDFIPVAEESGLIVRIGQLVILQSCEMLARMREVHPELCCGINLSVRQFMEGNLLRDLDAAIVGYDLPPDALTLEITESQVASHESVVLASMDQLRKRGFSFALDDFGVGFSSLDRLRRLPVSTLKIDRSFVSILSTRDDPIVRHIVSLAHDLGLRTVAEGVEDEGTRQRLLSLGCRDMQGYLYAKPMPEGALRLWLQHRVVSGRMAA